jgi:hypothetical protein
MPKPGQGMDPMMAMLGGMPPLGGPPPMAPQAPPPPGAVMGDGGMPLGGGVPFGGPGADPTMGGSDLLQAMNMALDPYGGDPDGTTSLNVGPSDPTLGLEQLLQLLALAQMGVGDPMAQPPGGSGVPMPPLGGGMM